MSEAYLLSQDVAGSSAKWTRAPNIPISNLKAHVWLASFSSECAALLLLEYLAAVTCQQRHRDLYMLQQSHCSKSLTQC